MMDEFEYTISDLVKKDYRTADVFRKYHLSYCCSGNIPLKSACEAKGIDLKKYLLISGGQPGHSSSPIICLSMSGHRIF